MSLQIKDFARTDIKSERIHNSEESEDDEFEGDDICASSEDDLLYPTEDELEEVREAVTNCNKQNGYEIWETGPRDVQRWSS